MAFPAHASIDIGPLAGYALWTQPAPVDRATTTVEAASTITPSLYPDIARASEKRLAIELGFFPTAINDADRQSLVGGAGSYRTIDNTDIGTSPGDEACIIGPYHDNWGFGPDSRVYGQHGQPVSTVVWTYAEAAAQLTLQRQHLLEGRYHELCGIMDKPRLILNPADVEAAIRDAEMIEDPLRPEMTRMRIRSVGGYAINLYLMPFDGPDTTLYSELYGQDTADWAQNYLADLPPDPETQSGDQEEAFCPADSKMTDEELQSCHNTTGTTCSLEGTRGATTSTPSALTGRKLRRAIIRAYIDDPNFDTETDRLNVSHCDPIILIAAAQNAILDALHEQGKAADDMFYISENDVAAACGGLGNNNCRIMLGGVDMSWLVNSTEFVQAVPVADPSSPDRRYKTIGLLAEAVSRATSIESIKSSSVLITL